MNKAKRPATVGKLITECLMAKQYGSNGQDTIFLQFFHGPAEVFNSSCQVPHRGYQSIGPLLKTLEYALSRRFVLFKLDKVEEILVYNGKTWGKLKKNERESHLLSSPVNSRQCKAVIRVLKPRTKKIIFVAD